MRSVALVLTEDFPGDARELAFRSALWLIDSEGNRATAEALWRAAAEWPQIDVTLINTVSQPDAAEWRHILAQIDLHHGPSAQRVPYHLLEVIGAELTPTAREALLDCGFAIFQPTVEGFRAQKKE